MQKKNKLKIIRSKRQRKATPDHQLRTRPGQTLELDPTRVRKDLDIVSDEAGTHPSIFAPHQPGCVFSDTDPSGTTCSIEGVETMKPVPSVATSLKDVMQEQKAPRKR
ncbi:hypothetical protein [Halodesulfovibrio marinisediminis]|uniref:hypothetical protein n=1 Tax=Halodesulfovibrio marinisediminis TaxID=458711 RepID=UPI0009408F87|nr:hypothetical protein [Halodesulfovibrio marinisediminis]